MITTDDPELAGCMRLFRNHGIILSALALRPQTSDFSWFYEMVDLSNNYRITDIQCALGLSQLKKLSTFFVELKQQVHSP